MRYVHQPHMKLVELLEDRDREISTLKKHIKDTRQAPDMVAYKKLADELEQEREFRVVYQTTVEKLHKKLHEYQKLVGDKIERVD